MAMKYGLKQATSDQAARQLCIYLWSRHLPGHLPALRAAFWAAARFMCDNCVFFSSSFSEVRDSWKHLYRPRRIQAHAHLAAEGWQAF